MEILITMIIYSGKSDGEFHGFDDNAVFKMSNGTYWGQSQYKYWDHYAYRPDALIEEENGRTTLRVAGHAVPVRRVYDVIESQIDGEFKGWSGDTSYKLTNGQVWKQAHYAYEYRYAYRPDVTICNINGMYVMSVDGLRMEVRRVK